MFGWQRNFLRHVGRRLESSHHSSANSPFRRADSFLLLGKSCDTQRLWKSPPASISRPFYYYLQQLGISSSRRLQVDSSNAAPVSSLLTSGLSSKSEKTEVQKLLSKPVTVRAIRKKIKQSPKKVNLVAKLVRGMLVADALLQLKLLVKRASPIVYQTILSARANAKNNHGLDPTRLIIAEAFVGKGLCRKEISYHSKGRSGIMIRPECRLTVLVREITVEEEAKIAKLKVSNFRKISHRDRKLIPHKLIEINPVWDRRANVRPRPSVVR